MKPTAAKGCAQAIIDASSAILLYKAGLIDQYCQMIPLLMTRSVFAEVTVPRQSGADALGDLADRQPGIRVIDDPCHPEAGRPAAEIVRLGRGERDTLLHYLEGSARYVVIDDGKAVRVCRRYGIPHVNALLVPKLLHFSRMLSAVQTDRYFIQLCSIGRYSDRVVDWAKTCGVEALDFFLVR